MRAYWVPFSLSRLTDFHQILLNLEPSSAFKLLKIWDSAEGLWSQEDLREFFIKIFGSSDDSYSASKIRSYLIIQNDRHWQTVANHMLGELHLL